MQHWKRRLNWKKKRKKKKEKIELRKDQMGVSIDYSSISLLSPPPFSVFIEENSFNLILRSIRIRIRIKNGN